MLKRATKLRIRRRYKRQKQQVENLGEQASQGIERLVFKRISNLIDVRRFISGWVGLLVIIAVLVVSQARALSSYYLSVQPVNGGIYSEGIVGSFGTANPLYATGSVDSSVVKLLFGSLLTYDENQNLVGDLAESWTSDAQAKVYTVVLKPNLRWHDGKALTANDVIFTYQTIQNPDAKSPLNISWQGIKVEKVNDRTIRFTLPNALVSFPYSMTNGIVPEHVLSGIPVAQLRSTSFNTNPIGSGPFEWGSLGVVGDTPETREERISLNANPNYHQGRPKVNIFAIRSFRSTAQMLTSYTNRELSAMAGLRSLPETLKNDRHTIDYDISYNSAIMVFLKNSQPVLKDVKVRQALTQATNRSAVIAALGYPALEVEGPLLQGQLGYNRSITELPYDLNKAKALLEEAGWKVGADGIRTKDNSKLSIIVTTQADDEYTLVGNELKRQWRDVGVDLQLLQVESSEFQASYLVPHNYDALLYGIAIGTDPDVFAFWHSSQADVRSQGRLNLSEYQSKPADQALEAGRTRLGIELRAAKYKTFLETWRNDAPAIGLYQPQFLYVTRDSVHGITARRLQSAADRYVHVENWTAVVRNQVKK